MAAAATVSGCGAYLHRPELARSTQQLRTSFSELSAPAYLKAQEDRLKEHAVREDRSVAEFHAASRDYSLLNIIGSTPANSRDPLDAEIGNRLLQTAGSNALAAAPSTLIESEAVRSRAAIRHEQVFDRQFALRSMEYRGRGGKAVQLNCRAIDDTSTPPADDPEDARRVYDQLQQICRRIRSERAATPADCSLGLRSGSLFQSCEALRALEIEAAGDQRTKPLQNAIKAHREAIEAANRPAPDLAARYDQLLQQARSGMSVDAYLGSYREVLQQLEQTFSFELGRSLDDISASASDLSDHPAHAAIRRSLVTLGAIHDLQAAAGGRPLDQPTALLIGLAKTRHDLNLVELDIERRRRLLALRQSEVAALRTQLHFLVRARRCLLPADPCGGGDAAVAQALSHLVSSHDSGLIPFRVLQARQGQVEQEFAVRHAQVTEADYRALLVPAIDQIVAYGAGGVRAEILAPFLANLPVTGAILGD